MPPKISWSLLLAKADDEGLWNNLYWMVSHHHSTRSFITANGGPRGSLQDMFADLTQDLFLKLFEKDRWQYYLDAGYTDQTIEHELNHVEIPNLVSQQLRKLRPESYRMARRISTILSTSPEFECFRSDIGSHRPHSKLAHRIYGLACWPANMAMKEEAVFPELGRNVHFRIRDTRRAGRASTSQVIISNNALRELLIDMFKATQSVMEVRMVRSFALSKIAVEDSKFSTIDGEVGQSGQYHPNDYRIDLADRRPTPEEILLNHEAAFEIHRLAVNLIVDLERAVRYKSSRFRKLVRVVWHCYFDSASPSQTQIARSMCISGSLVCHYKKLFEYHVQQIDLSTDQWVMLNDAIESQFTAKLSEIDASKSAYLQPHLERLAS
jgi:hypothetical protein